MKKIKLNRIFLILITIILGVSCRKDWLDAKPNKALVVPSTIDDYQALLDNINYGSEGMNIGQPGLGMVSDGDYYITDASFNSLSGYPPEQGAYIWADTPDFFGGQADQDWIKAFARILRTNVVLDGIPNIKTNFSNQEVYNNLKGSALFYRSYNFYTLSQQYCKVYSTATANTDLGLPLRLSSNVNLIVDRASVQKTYDQIIGDLEQAIKLLPVIPLYPTRPSKPAAYGLLARLYLSQENYSKALLYADSCLQLKKTLIDFNKLSITSLNPITYFNEEVIFQTQLSSYVSATPKNLIVDPTLYQSYNSNDLRLSIYFVTNSGDKTIKTSYIGSASQLFGGIATDEMYLNRAECYARTGKISEAMNDLNFLLKNRYKTGSFTNLTVSNADAALAAIITERRKELCFRNLRWPDLRRLNKDPRFKVTLTRIVNGKTFTLLPNSPRYTLPLDPIETASNGLKQNPRN